jgi:hypothetical protein
MPIPSGLSAQFGAAIETTPGTRVAPAVFPELTSESIRRNPQHIWPMGLRNRLTPPAPVIVGYRPAGDIQLDVSAETIGPFLRAGIGAVSTSGSGTYTHVITPSVTTLPPSMTLQFGKPTAALSSTVEVQEFTGCYVNAWELSLVPDQFVAASFSWDGMLVDDGQTIATPTYPTLTRFVSTHATLTASGGTECVNSLNITGALSNDVKPQLGCSTYPGTNKILPAAGGDWARFGGSFNRDFRNTDMYDDMVAGTVATLTLALTSGSFSLTITGTAQLMDGMANIGGPGVLQEDVPFVFVRASDSATDASAFTATLVNNVATI